MSTTFDVERAMSSNSHELPGSGMHSNNATREQWCYCVNCEALGAVRADGTMYGKATREQCTNIGGTKIRKPPQTILR